MQTSLAPAQPFSFAQSVTFLRRFPPCQGEYVLADDAVTAAVSVAGRAVPFTIRAAAADAPLVVETPRAADLGAVAAVAAGWLGVDDDLAAFYAAAAGDPPMRALVEALRGLHHVRFLTLAEIAVYCVMMQRTPIAAASAMKRRFLDAFGAPVEVAGRTLRAMPTLAELVELDGQAIGAAIRHPRKGAMIETVVRGVAAIGEATLRSAPYGEARDALLAIHGIGPFSAGAILLRGLGRMDEVPSLAMFARDAEAVYGAPIDEAAIARRYGDQIGYWSFYLKTGAARRRA
jgi:DNA-3-methyladenine glycosylase II